MIYIYIYHFFWGGLKTLLKEKTSLFCSMFFFFFVVVVAVVAPATGRRCTFC